jgi:hypothetical protein
MGDLYFISRSKLNVGEENTFRLEFGRNTGTVARKENMEPCMTCATSRIDYIKLSIQSCPHARPAL